MSIALIKMRTVCPDSGHLIWIEKSAGYLVLGF